jgi:hypothetical protein
MHHHQRLLGGCFALALLSASGSLSAHIDLKPAGTHVSRYEQGARGADTKQAPCGNPKGTPTGASYTYKPGETITVSAVEYVSHPGYFRIAFDADGDDDFVDPRWIVPLDPANREGGCPLDEHDQCRTGNPLKDGDFFNNKTVLLDNLNPHLGTPGVPVTYSWQVKLPDVECDRCTLQLIQVMMDPARGFHGAYHTQPGDNNDVYHQCIDLRLKR